MWNWHDAPPEIREDRPTGTFISENSLHGTGAEIITFFRKTPIPCRHALNKGVPSVFPDFAHHQSTTPKPRRARRLQGLHCTRLRLFPCKNLDGRSIKWAFPRIAHYQSPRSVKVMLNRRNSLAVSKFFATFASPIRKRGLGGQG